MNTGAALLLERVRAATEDEYTIESELGRGGMAAVFLARDIALGRRVAIKVMLPDLVDVEGIQDRFVIEAKTAAQLDHPGIVTVYSVKQRAGLLFIVMKYIEGRTLEGLLRAAGRLEPVMAMSIVRQVAEALQFAHLEGVVHRDVKPSNIIIDTRGRPIVTDFGIAKVTSARSITVTGSMLGTPTYMSPEQCRGLQATAASDQYSLGVMAYELLVGRVPFSGTIYELIHSHCTEPPPPIDPAIDPAITETVLRMLAKSPPERWESLTEVARRLAAAVPPDRKSDEIQAAIAQFVRGDEKTQVRRAARTLDLAGAATEVATTPAQTTPAPALVITPSDPTVETGQSVRLRVTEASGASLAGVTITWRSEDPTIAAVDDKGVVTGRSTGVAKITATGGAAVGRVAVTVHAATADTLVVTPQNPEIVADSEIQFVATVLDARGQTLPGQSILWQSSDVSVCAVSSTGLAIGIAPGQATITAVVGDIRGTAQARVRLPAVERVTVDPGEVSVEAEETRRLTATAWAANERKLTGRPITWRSSVPTVVTVDANGVIKGISAGTAAVIATCDGKDGLTSITVRSQPVVAVRIQHEQLQLEVGRSIQLKGVGEDRRGRAVTDTPIEWHSDNDQIALVDASGKVHAVKEGRTTVRAVAGEATSTVPLTVIPRAAASIRIETHKPKIDAGEFITLDATVLDADGGALQNRAVTWTSSDPAVVSINAHGSCEAKKPGSVRITAACERARATTKLSVAAVPVAPVAAEDAETQVIEAQRPRAASSPPPASSRPPAMQEPRTEKRPAWMVPAAIAFVTVAGIGGWMATRGGSTDFVADTTMPVKLGAASAPPAATVSDTTTVSAPPVQEQKTAPPVTNPPETKQTETKQVASNSGASTPPRGQTPPRTQTQTQGQTQTQAQAQTPPQRSGRGTTTDSGAARGVTPPVQVDTPVTARGNTQPPVTNTGTNVPPPVVTPPVVEGPNPLLCANADTPTTLLTQALGSDPAATLNRLYQGRDAADNRAKDAMLGEVRGLSRAQSRVRNARANVTGSDCDWTVVVEFSGRTFVGGTTRTWQMNVDLEAPSGTPRIRQIYGAVKR